MATPRKKKRTKKRPPIRRKIIVASLAGILMLAVCGVLLYFAVLWGVFGKIPNQQELSKIQNDISSDIFSADGVIIGKYYTERRSEASFNELSPNIINALLAIEDIRFFQHKGVDNRSMLRVIVKSLLMQQTQYGGGSTITQQLAKNLYPRIRRGMRINIVPTKIRELIIARRLEKVFSKSELLELYLNTVPFSENNYGIKSACEFYFNTTPSQIKAEEAALLIGMLKAPTSYNPIKNPEQAVERRNIVIAQMLKYELMSADRADSLSLLPLKLNIKKRGHNEGLATYFREQLRGELKDWCKANPKKDGTEYNIYQDGLKIHTSIHSVMQKYAEAAVADHMKKLQSDFSAHWKSSKPWDRNPELLQTAIKRSARYQNLKAKKLSEAEISKVLNKKIPMTIFSHLGEVTKEMSPLDSIKYYLMILHTGFIAMDAKTGYVTAYVGGIDHEYFKYNHVLASRQVGSTFKPIVYAAALEKGIAPCDLIANDSVVYTEYKNWSPKNSSGYGGWYTLKGGLTKSVNSISVKLIMDIGINTVTTLAKKMGIESYIPGEPSIALGAADISLQEMATAYCAFSNRGISIEPKYLLRIEDAQGKVLADFTKTTTRKRVLTQDNADIMINMMQSVVDSGTARRLRTTYGLRNKIAGKTGTTQSHADGWFIGFTPKILAGVWVGGEDRRIHFRTISQGQGANMALPIWAKFLQQLNKDPQFKSWQYASFQGMSPELHSQTDCPLFLQDLSRSSFADDDLFEENKRKQKELKQLEKQEERDEKNLTTSPTKADEGDRFLDKLKDLFKKDPDKKKKRKSKN